MGDPCWWITRYDPYRITIFLLTFVNVVKKRSLLILSANQEDVLGWLTGSFTFSKILTCNDTVAGDIHRVSIPGGALHTVRRVVNGDVVFVAAVRMPRACTRSPLAR